jgi:hypothetical protein
MDLPLQGTQKAAAVLGRHRFAQLGVLLLCVAVLKSVVLPAVGSQQPASLLAPRGAPYSYAKEASGGIFDAMNDPYAQAKLPKVNVDSWTGNPEYHGVSVFKAHGPPVHKQLYHPWISARGAARVQQKARAVAPETFSAATSEDGAQAQRVHETAARDAAKMGILPPPSDEPADAPPQQRAAASAPQDDAALDGVLARTAESSENADGVLADEGTAAEDAQNEQGPLNEPGAARAAPPADRAADEVAAYPGGELFNSELAPETEWNAPAPDESWRAGGDDGSWRAHTEERVGGALSEVAGEAHPGWQFAGHKVDGALTQVAGEGASPPWAAAGKLFGGALSQVKGFNRQGALAYVRAESAGGTLAAAPRVLNNGGALAQVPSANSGGALAAVRGGNNGGALAIVRGGPSGGSLSQLRSGPSGGALSQVRSGPYGGSLSQVREGSSGGALSQLGNTFAGGSLAALAPADAGGSLAAVRGSSRAAAREDVDGSLLTSAGDDMAAGALSAAGGAREGDGWLAKARAILQPGADAVHAALGRAAGQGAGAARKMLREIRTEAEALAGEEARKLQHVRREQRKIQAADARTQKKAAALEKDVQTTWDAVQARIAAQEAHSGAATEEPVPVAGARARHAAHRMQAAADAGRGRSKREAQLDGEEGEEGGAEEGDPLTFDNVGWDKDWSLTTWVAYIVFGPILSAGVVFTVHYYTGTVAAVVTALFLVGMDIASYYYSWFVF